MVDTWNLNTLRPSEQNIRLVGVATEGGRSMSGYTRAIDFSGGGFWQVQYNRIPLRTPTQHLLYNRYAGQLASPANRIRIPFLNYFLDTDSYAGNLIGPYDINEATVDITMTSGHSLIGGEYFGINHGGTWGFRVYRIWDIDSSAAPNFTVAIQPPLRQPIAVATGGTTALDFSQPLCAMRLPAGETADYYSFGWRQADPSLTFVEWFPGG